MTIADPKILPTTDAIIPSATQCPRAVEQSKTNYYRQLREVEVEDALQDNTTPLQKFYKKQCIFITGGTGFLGKFLIRKLFQVCPDIECIFVLIRSKDNKTINQRKHELIFDPILEDVRLKYPEIVEKICAVEGNCTLSNLGLSAKDRLLLLNKVSIVFHVAGAAIPNDDWRTAIELNCKSTAAIGKLCEKMKNLLVFMYVSSAYSYNFKSVMKKCYDDEIQEVLDIVNQMSENHKDDYSNRLTKLPTKYVNNYTFSKEIAESWIKAEIGKKLPVGIFRPGLLLPSAEEPKPGFCEKTGGMIKIIMYVMQGILRIMRADGEQIANLVPVDMAANALLSCAHDVALYSDDQIESTIIYNYVSEVDAPVTWNRFRNYLNDSMNEYPHFFSLWYGILHLARNDYVYQFYTFFYHWIAANLMDFVSYMEFREPNIRSKVMEAQKLAEDFNTYTLNEWNYTSKETEAINRVWQQALEEEKNICNFDMKNFNWKEYISNCVQGIRLYALNDPPSTLFESRKRYRVYKDTTKLVRSIFYWMICFVTLWILVGYWLCCFIVEIL